MSRTAGFGIVLSTLFLVFGACVGPGDDSGIIVGGGDLEHGEICDEPGQCGDGLVCAGDGTCRFVGEPGTLPIGQECATPGNCALGLTCSSNAICAEPGEPGTAAHGDTCAGELDCQLGLTCGEAGTCTGVQMPFWPGASCSDPDVETGEFRVFFEVPADDAPADEFYRMPFPNDGRVREDGTLDLSGHARPGLLIPELGDVVGNAFETMETTFDGFGPNQSIFFRFSHRIDFDTVSLGVPGEGTAAVIDITPDTPEYGQRVSGGWQSHTGERQYICHNWFELHPASGRPLTPGHTYAAIIATGVRKSGTNIGAAQDEDFQHMLNPNAPADARLLRTWEAYQPLRDYLEDSPWPGSALASAAVFTVSDPTQYPQRLRESVWNNADTPVPTNVVSCEDDAQTYGNDDDSDRGCSVSSDFYELQGTLPLPHYQDGTAPYKDATDGGAIDFSFATMLPDHTEQVVFSLTVPKNATMPAAGWPIVMYGHGTGGKYRSAALNGVASNLAAVALDDGTEVNFATLSIDQVMHGPRRHPENFKSAWLELDPSSYDADVLYFNPLNPAAARDNALQSAVDWFAITRMLSEGAMSFDDGFTGQAITFDPDQIYYLGHSQGSVGGMNFVPYEPEVNAVVLSGGGGLLIESLLNKKSPFDLPAAISVGIADPFLTRYHPLLNLVQMLSERADGVNHAPKVFHDPVDGVPPKDVLQTFGIGDTYSPDETQYALARAMRVVQIAADSEPLEFVPNGGSEPVFQNHTATGQTVAVRLYEHIGGGDGHFVIFDRNDAQRQYAHFLATAVRDGYPTLVTPTP